MSTATVTRPSVQTRERTQHFPRYKVFCHNDDTTTMEFVVAVLHLVFGLALPQAHKVMLEVHNEEVAFVGAFTMEQAEFRIEQAHSLARAKAFPLTLTMEPE